MLLEELRVALPVKSAPFWSLRRAAGSVKVISPTMLVPFRMPAEEVKIRSAPPERVMLPPLIVPPTSRHDPLAALRSKVVPVLLSTPVRLTVPPERTMLPAPPVENVPPRVSVEFVELIVPPFAQFPPSVNVPPVPIVTLFVLVFVAPVPPRVRETRVPFLPSRRARSSVFRLQHFPQ